MKKLNLLAVLLLTAFIASCSNSPKQLLIGKWKPTGKTANDSDAPVQMEFTKDKIKMGMGGMVMEMNYKWAGDDQIEMELMGQKMTAQIKVDKKTLTMTVEGEAETFERAK